jgi:DNA-binding response OmpR family regulator
MKTIKILIIDKSINRDLFKLDYLDLDYEISGQVNNYKDALEIINNSSPDFILIDININGNKDGIQTIKSINKIKNIPFIYITSVTNNDIINKAIRTGPCAYLIKPFFNKSLVIAIKLAMLTSKKINNTDLGYGFHMDNKNKIICYNNIQIQLSLNERLFFNLLLTNKKKVSTFLEIEEKIFGYERISSNSLKQLVYRFRKKTNNKVIKTLTSGYILNMYFTK